MLVINYNLIDENVIVCGNVDAYSEQIAEHFFGLLLYIAKGIRQNMDDLKNGMFQQTYTRKLKNMNIIIVGYGGIGRAVAKIAKSFSMHVIAINRDGKKTDSIADDVYSVDALDSILQNGDVIALSLPLTSNTLNIINKKRLELMKNNAILINVGRGALVNEDDLFEYLSIHPDFQFGTDVWWHYPEKHEIFRQKYEFFSLKNFTGTPHNSSMVEDQFEIAIEKAVKNIERYLDNIPLHGVANRSEYLGLPKKTAPMGIDK